MKDRIKDLFSSCSEIDFGAVTLSDGEKGFCSELNNEITLLCKSLPESTQPDALLFLRRFFRIPSGRKFSIFMQYYAPSWSVIYWIIQSCANDKDIEVEDRKWAITAHTMALLLHPLDDHLNDGQIPTSHLTLLFRSQAWMIMNNALNRLADGIDGGHKIVKVFLDHYYAGIFSSERTKSLDDFSDLFRKQMATWLIVPILLTKSIHNDRKVTEAIQSAYESFGIAWRLLDDINDIETDMTKGVHSSVYNCLPENIRNYWDKVKEAKKNSYSKAILDYILENSVIERIKVRICNELDLAASTADAYNMPDWADEFRCLLSPLKKGRESL